MQINESASAKFPHKKFHISNHRYLSHLWLRPNCGDRNKSAIEVNFSRLQRNGLFFFRCFMAFLEWIYSFPFIAARHFKRLEIDCSNIKQANDEANGKKTKQKKKKKKTKKSKRNPSRSSKWAERVKEITISRNDYSPKWTLIRVPLIPFTQTTHFNGN